MIVIRRCPTPGNVIAKPSPLIFPTSALVEPRPSFSVSVKPLPSTVPVNALEDDSTPESSPSFSMASCREPERLSPARVHWMNTAALLARPTKDAAPFVSVEAVLPPHPVIASTMTLMITKTQASCSRGDPWLDRSGVGASMQEVSTKDGPFEVRQCVSTKVADLRDLAEKVSLLPKQHRSSADRSSRGASIWQHSKASRCPTQGHRRAARPNDPLSPASRTSPARRPFRSSGCRSPTVAAPLGQSQPRYTRDPRDGLVGTARTGRETDPRGTHTLVLSLPSPNPDPDRFETRDGSRAQCHIWGWSCTRQCRRM